MKEPRRFREFVEKTRSRLFNPDGTINLNDILLNRFEKAASLQIHYEDMDNYPEEA